MIQETTNADMKAVEEHFYSNMFKDVSIRLGHDPQRNSRIVLWTVEFYNGERYSRTYSVREELFNAGLSPMREILSDMQRDLKRNMTAKVDQLFAQAFATVIAEENKHYGR